MHGIKISIHGCRAMAFAGVLTMNISHHALADDAAAFDHAMERAQKRAAEWRAAVEAMPESQRDGLRFVISHMPLHDLATLRPEEVSADIALAYKTRIAVPWGKDIPDSIFFNDVLPYAHLTEPREAWRADFTKRFLPLVMKCKTPGEAAVKLNSEIWPLLGVKYSPTPERADQGPLESIRYGTASCTGLSILLANACRAVCVPARVAGIAQWPHKKGNHTWTEIWSEGGWHFLGAVEPGPLDQAWFTADTAFADPAKPVYSVLAASWKPTGQHFIAGYVPLISALPEVSAENVTARYLPAAGTNITPRVYLELVDPNGMRTARQVKILVGGKVAREGSTRDFSSDLNDAFWFELPRGKEAVVEIRKPDGTVESQRIRSKGEAHQFEYLETK